MKTLFWEAQNNIFLCFLKFEWFHNESSVLLTGTLQKKKSNCPCNVSASSEKG